MGLRALRDQAPLDPPPVRFSEDGFRSEIQRGRESVSVCVARLAIGTLAGQMLDDRREKAIDLLNHAVGAIQNEVVSYNGYHCVCAIG